MSDVTSPHRLKLTHKGFEFSVSLEISLSLFLQIQKKKNDRSRLKSVLCSGKRQASSPCLRPRWRSLVPMGVHEDNRGAKRKRKRSGRGRGRGNDEQQQGQGPRAKAKAKAHPPCYDKDRVIRDEH